MLLAPAWLRLAIAACMVVGLWAAVLAVAPSVPSADPAPPPVRVAALRSPVAAGTSGPLRAIIRSGAAAPGGGRFDRFNVVQQPVGAPINAAGQVAFFATVLRSPAREGIFLADGGRILKVAAIGDPVPGGGALAGFADHPTPALNAAGHVAFAAQVGGGRGSEGIFLAASDGLRVIALAGTEAPGMPNAVLAGFDAPALNDNDELAFVATVRRGRETVDVLYLWNGQRLQRLLAEGDRLLRIGGTMDKIGTPALNNAGVVAFPGAVVKGPTPGGIFTAGARDLRLMVSAGERIGDGAMILRVSERVALDEEDGIAFGAYLGAGGATHEAILRTGPDGLADIAREGAPAPGGGRYAGFGPWPTIAPGGLISFVAALDGGPGPLAAFTGRPGAITRAVSAGEALPNGGRVGRFALNAVAMAGGADLLTVVTMAEDEAARSAIYCRCP